MLYRLAQLHGVTPLSGTTDEEHMQQAVEAEKIELAADDQNIRGLLAWMGLSR